ncbi:breast carcinoma-amplified sequence 1 isoform X2 [Mastacembelus armatus]|uniref:breast carcinoma-amplified sequence 1 isoform X2 n=1 Tax=Mastacembelus armatus TaxID=205130 RepID=UPI000E4544F0|nr:shootin-1-like isoform X2 [Mastacembelus armatus]
MGNDNSKNTELSTNDEIPEKHENGSVNGLSENITPNGLEGDANDKTTIHQNGKPLSLALALDSTEILILEPECQPAEASVNSEIPETTIQKEEVKKNKEEKVNLFGKMFKKKAQPPTDVNNEAANEDQTDASPPIEPQQETANLQQELEGATLDLTPENERAPETKNNQPVEKEEETNPEENPVMNFFKTFVTTKTSKKETVTPDATKDQVAQVSEPPAAPKGMSIPPPPPPEPPKMEIKGEAAAKSAKPTPKEEPKAAATELESSKGKSAKHSLSKLFRTKTIKEPPLPAVEVEVQPVIVQSENKVKPQETAEELVQPVVEEQVVEELPQFVIDAQKVDPSKAGTLEAAAKPEQPAPVQEEKKTATKPTFRFFKTKAAAPKEATSTPAVAAETSQSVKTKDEPKAAVKSPEVVTDSKPASAANQAGDDGANVPRKLEKRNSIQLFFKILSQKRHSTDAGVQTEPVTVAPAEKTK